MKRIKNTSVILKSRFDIGIKSIEQNIGDNVGKLKLHFDIGWWKGIS
jgi:hypothetical protein